MEDLLHRFRHLRHGSQGHLRHGSSPFRTIKRALIVGAILCIIVAIALVILAIAALNWMFSQVGETAQKAQETVQQSSISDATSLPDGSDTGAMEPLSLAAYVNNGAMATDQLIQTYENLPAQLQGLWLDQFQAQLDSLREQAGISPEAIRSLSNIYTTLQQ